MSTKVIPYDLPTKSPRKVKKVLSFQEEFKQYGLKVEAEQEDLQKNTEHAKEAKRIVDCKFEDREWTDSLLEYADDRFDAEDSERVQTVNVEGNNGIAVWETTVPNPTIITRTKRIKPAAPDAEAKERESTELRIKRSKEHEFVDAPAWRICVEPSTYKYVANNGRYRASKLAKKFESQRQHAKRVQYQQETRLTPERQQLQREIQRELRKEFEMYVRLEKEKSMLGNQLKEKDEMENHGSKKTPSKGEEQDTSDSDLERYEAKEWRSGKKAKLDHPLSVLIVPPKGPARRKDGTMRKEKTQIFPPLDTNTLTGDQFLQEVSSRLLNWEHERRREIGVHKSIDSEHMDVPSSREHRSKSEPPTMSELIDRHQQRAGYYAEFAVRENYAAADSNYGSIPLSIRGSNSAVDEEQVKYRLPKNRTESTSLVDHYSRLRPNQNSAPNERILSQLKSEPTQIGLSADSSSRLPPRGESLPMRTPAKTINQPVTKTETVGSTTFSVRKISGSSNVSDPHSVLNDVPEDWDIDDRAIDAVYRTQVVVPHSQDTSPMHKPKTKDKAAVDNDNPLNAMAVMNYIRYTPGGSEVKQVPKAKPDDMHVHTHVHTNGYDPNQGEGNPHDVIIQGCPTNKELQILMKTTKIGNSLKISKGDTTRSKMTHSANRSNTMPSDRGARKEKRKVVEPDPFFTDETVIGVAGKKIGFNETVQRII